MTDRFVTVPDSLELPAAVKVPSARLSDSTAAGRALLASADAAAQRASLGLGTAATHAHGDYATAAQGAKADATEVHQITLIGNLALTIPEGFPSGQVYRAAIVQDGTGGHTVTYGGVTVPVDLTAGASTTVELWHDGSAWQWVVTLGRRRAGAGTYTTGDVLTLGRYAHHQRADAGTGIVAGGAPINHENVVGGNTASVNTANSNLDGAPALTDQDGNWDFILSGYDNVVNGWACVVNGFHQKVEATANHITIAGGSIHSVAAGSSYSSIGGGTGHTLSGVAATVAGGTQNVGSGDQSAIGGGRYNQATGLRAVVAGGESNTASNTSATVGGGLTNTASSNASTVGGGLTNTASGIGATVPGGRENVASGDYSVAFGRGAVAYDNSQIAHSPTPFVTAGDAQSNQWVLKKETTTATQADMLAAPIIPENTTWAFTALVVARRADADGENAAWEVKGLMKRDAGGTGALVGTPSVTAIGANAGNTWALAVGAYSIGTLRFLVTGEASKTIRWVVSLRAASVSG